MMAPDNAVRSTAENTEPGIGRLCQPCPLRSFERSNRYGSVVGTGFQPLPQPSVTTVAAGNQDETRTCADIAVSASAGASVYLAAVASISTR